VFSLAINLCNNTKKDKTKKYCFLKINKNFFIWQAIVRGRPVSTGRPFFFDVYSPLLSFSYRQNDVWM